MQLGPAMPNLRRRCGGREGGLQCFALRSRVQLRIGDLREVWDLDAAEIVLASQFDAAKETVVRADHPPAEVPRVAEATQRCRLQLGRTRGARQLQALAVFAQAALDVGPREEEVAAQIVDARALSR